MSYDNKTNEELIELLEDRDESIDKLKQEVETMIDDYNESAAEASEMYADSLDKQEQEELASKSFYAGYDCADTDGTLNALKLKAWLNYKMENML